MEKTWTKVEAPRIPAWNGTETLKDGSKKFLLSEGDELEGTLVGVKTIKGSNGKDSLLFKLKKEGGEFAVVWGTSVLGDMLQSLPMGSLVKITYLGDVQGKDKMKRPYHNYEVFHADGEIPIVEEEEELDIKDIPF